MADRLEVTLEIWCSECGTALTVQGDVKKDNWGDYQIKVEPCEKCLEAAREKDDA